MSLELLFPAIKRDDNFKKVLGEIREDNKINVFINSSLRPFLVASIYDELSIPMLVVVSELEEGEKFVGELSSFLSYGKAEIFPDLEVLSHERMSSSKEVSTRRIEIISQLIKRKPMIVVVTIQTLMRNLPPLDSSSLEPLKLKVGADFDFSDLIVRFTEMGYDRVPKVEDKGDFSVRGGIVDIFPPNLDHPFRVEFYGDTVDSIRYFDLSTQLSISNEKNLNIFSCREVFLSSDNVKRALSFLNRAPRKQDWLLEDIERLKTYGHFEGVERYVPFLFDRLKNFLDYFPSDGLVILDDEKKLESEAASFYEKQLSYLNDSISREEFLNSPESFYLSFEEVKKKLSKSVNLFAVQHPEEKTAAHFISATVEPMLGKLERLKELLIELKEAGLAAVIAVKDRGRVERLIEILQEWDFDVVHEPKSIIFGKVNVLLADLQEGFYFPDLKIVMITESDIFIKHRKFRQDKQIATTKSIISLSDISVGDYVVHEEHGIGKFMGMTVREIEGIRRDYLLLAYANGDKLYVPLAQIDKVSKYIGTDSHSPKLNKLGSLKWFRAKKRARKSVKKLAIDLLNLYAHRLRAKGYAHSKDTLWQREMEEAFPFDETPDQLQSIKEVKVDMEDERPMDRLVCGDVGYGKTEVALRATFKTIMDGKQVLMLAPTTILAQQHFNTFLERFSPYPINIELLSRFKPPKESRVIIDGLKEGHVDIVIGTHRLLQKDVGMKNLGLVVIDEEQRFGVAHKEHLRELRKTVDVLALSATPIPRTLQMSLSGVRDMSIINTPPEDRYPILTRVMQYDEKMIRDAIRREINRGGQVYYVHNRVKTIYKTVKMIAGIVPEARIAVAHGQMKEHDLEKVMLDFLAKKFDILLCTTIIESGIDIPTVNTLIVDEADKLGLAQMYQLRGRVGRSHHRAYAYFLFPSDKLLTATAFSRLKTISEFTELGSGIKIAMRDLEIRGAGNLLGPQQHGHMAAVGFDLYNQFLRDAVGEIQGEVVPARPTKTEIDLPLDVFIPRDYIEEETLRIEAYRLIVFAKDAGAIDGVRSNLRDRFGGLPEPVENLIEIAKIKILARSIGLRGIICERRRLTLKNVSLSKKKTSFLQEKYKGLIYKSQIKALVINDFSKQNILFFLRDLFDDIIRTRNN
ncbi:MAG TPA: transcription-repair coupling factor [Actinobacteria bacterium]|nr:transcription-repair coupling factor [Actinomycetota bacterium]